MTEDGSEFCVYKILSDYFLVSCTGGLNYLRNSNWKIVTSQALDILLSRPNLPQKIHKKVRIYL